MVRTTADDIAELIGLKYYPKAFENKFVKVHRVFLVMAVDPWPVTAWCAYPPRGPASMVMDDGWRVEDKETGVTAIIDGTVDNIEACVKAWRGGMKLGMLESQKQMKKALGLS